MSSPMPRSWLDAQGRRWPTVVTVVPYVLLGDIYGKLGDRDRAAAVAEGYNRGLLTPGKTAER
jgi:hypothetical protein